MINLTWEKRDVNFDVGWERKKTLRGEVIEGLYIQ
jgi:hypothetical protein